MSNRPVGRLGSFAQGLIRTASLECQNIRLGGWAPSPKRSSISPKCQPRQFGSSHTCCPMVARLGVLRVDEVTREILGEVIQKIKASGLGVSTIEHVRMPLRGFYRDLVERKVLTVNPARISDSSRGACDGASASSSSRPRKPPNSSLLRSANEATGKKRRRPGLRAPPSEQRPTDLAATTASDADEARNTQAPDRRGSTCPRSIRDRSRRTALGPRPRRLAARLPPHSLPLRRRWTRTASTTN